MMMLKILLQPGLKCWKCCNKTISSQRTLLNTMSEAEMMVKTMRILGRKGIANMA